MYTDFLGLKMKNPLIVAAGPWNRDGESMRRALENGAGAVITESIVSDAIQDVSPRIAYDGQGVQNIRMYSDIQIEGWERELKIAKSGGGIVIASVSAHTPSEVAYLASKMEKFGADAIEISISNPMGESFEIAAASESKVYEITKEVVSSVKIPVMVKLSQTATNITQVAKAAERAGASAISAINTIRCILGVDIETGKTALPTFGGYSGAPIRPIGLAATASIAQAVDIPVCGVGGVSEYTHALEYIMLGASAVQIGTAVMLNGSEIIGKMAEALDAWAQSHGVTGVSDIRGRALRRMKSLKEMTVEPARCSALEVPCISGCRKCSIACVSGALKIIDGQVHIARNVCNGCGLCVDLCEQKKLVLEW